MNIKDENVIFSKDAGIKSLGNECEQLEERNLKTSPFAYYKDMRYTLVKKMECSETEFRRLSRGGNFNEAHIAVLRVLYNYSYLNAFLIRTAIGAFTDGNITLKSVACRKILKSLVNQGMVLQYSFKYKDDNNEEQGSPHIYKLSSSGMRYIEKKDGSGSLCSFFRSLKLNVEPFSVVSVLNLLAFNQFHILFCKQYKERSYFGEAFYYSVKQKSRVFPGFYTLTSKKEKLSFRFFVFSIRLNNGWEKEFLSMLRDASRFVHNSTFDVAGVMVICETEHQAMDAMRYKSCDVELKKLSLWFVCDIMMLESDDIMSQLIEVYPNEDFSTRNIFSFDFAKLMGEETNNSCNNFCGDKKGVHEEDVKKISENDYNKVKKEN